MFKRIANLFRGFFGGMVSSAERKHPEALLENESENIRKQTASYNQGLITHAAMLERLGKQVKKLEADQADLRAKTGSNLRAGNRQAAGEYAVRLQNVERDLAEVRIQLDQANKTYQDMTRARDVAIATAKQKIATIRSDIAQLKTKKSQAELTETATGMVTEIGASGETLNRLEEMVEDERSKAAGRLRMATGSMQTAGVEMKAVEQKALAEQALADFAAKEGIALEPRAGEAAQAAAAPEAARKSMGPAAPEPETPSQPLRKSMGPLPETEEVPDTPSQPTARKSMGPAAEPTPGT